MELHPQGQFLYNKYKGKNATEHFYAHDHPKTALIKKENFIKGIYDPNFEDK